MEEDICWRVPSRDAPQAVCVSTKHNVVITLVAPEPGRFQLDPFRPILLHLFSLNTGQFIRSVQTGTCFGVSQALCVCPGGDSVLIGYAHRTCHVEEVDIANVVCDPRIRFVGREEHLATPVCVDCNLEVVVVVEYDDRFWYGYRISLFAWTDGTLISRSQRLDGAIGSPRDVHILSNCREMVLTDDSMRVLVFNFSEELVSVINLRKELVARFHHTSSFKYRDVDKHNLRVALCLLEEEVVAACASAAESCRVLANPTIEFQSYYDFARVSSVGVVLVNKSNQTITLFGTPTLRCSWLYYCAFSCK